MVMIHDKKLFKQKTLPKFFKNVKYTSFTKQMRRWGFICVSGGAPRHNVVSFSNPMFIRGEKEICKKISSVEQHHQEPLESRGVLSSSSSCSSKMMRGGDGQSVQRTNSPTLDSCWSRRANATTSNQNACDCSVPRAPPVAVEAPHTDRTSSATTSPLTRMPHPSRTSTSSALDQQQLLLRNSDDEPPSTEKKGFPLLLIFLKIFSLHSRCCHQLHCYQVLLSPDFHYIRIYSLPLHSSPLQLTPVIIM